MPTTHRSGAPTRQPGMTDVARLAGVSHQTVSRVLNDHPSVRPETRARVNAAIEELGYRRNVAARALVTRRSHIIGVLTTGEARFGPTSTLLAVEDAARDAGYYLSLAVTRHPTQASVAAALDHFRGQSVEGVVVIAPQTDAVVAARAVATSVPVVMVAAGEHSGPGFQTVAVDQEAGAALATRHLLDLGHRDVIHLSGPTDWLDARMRIEGWRAERARWGLPRAEPIGGDWSADRGYEAGREMVANARAGGPALPTAVFAANDQLALGLLRAFAEAGVAVPGEVSVVGFDDVEGTAFFSPPLTTVRQDFVTLGERCIDLLVAALRPGDDAAGPTPLGEPGPDADVESIPPVLVVRASTAPPRQG